MTLPDINLQLMDFPSTKEHEIITLNEDDSYTIFINSRLSTDMQRKAYLHALSHIINDDFSSDKSADTIEYERHKNNGR